MGLANAASMGQSWNGFRSLFKTLTSCILKILGIILEKSMDKAPRSGLAVGLWAFCTAGAPRRGTRTELGDSQT